MACWVAAARPAFADPLAAPPVETDRRCSGFSDKQRVVGALFEGSDKGDALGLRLHETRRTGAGCGEGAILWASYGADLRVIARDFRAVDAVLGQLSGRAGGLGGPGPGVSLELGAGLGPSREGLYGSGFAGAFLTFYYLDVGATYHFPIGRSHTTDWIDGGRLAIRLHVPVRTYDTHTSHE